MANASAVETRAEIERLHQADTDSIVENSELSKAQKLEALDHVERKWRPVYDAWRAFRAALAVSRAALVVAETRELAGLEPDLGALADAISAVLLAKQATLETLP